MDVTPLITAVRIATTEYKPSQKWREVPEER
jgi:hypothetical protein